MIRIVLLGKRASARPTNGQRVGSAAAPASAAISVRRDVKQRAIEGPPEFEDVDLRQFYQGVGPAASGTGRTFMQRMTTGTCCRAMPPWRALVSVSFVSAVRYASAALMNVPSPHCGRGLDGISTNSVG